MTELTVSLICFFISALLLIVLFAILNSSKTKNTPSTTTKKPNTSNVNASSKPHVSPRTEIYIKKRGELYTLLADDFIHECDLFFEVSVLYYVLSGFALTAVGINPTLLFQEFRLSTTPYDENKFNKRVNLYMSLGNMRLRDYCHLLELNNEPDFVYQCITLFFDILVHPECADNYSSAPFKIEDMFWLLNIKTKYTPMVYKSAIELINDMMK